MQKKKEKKNERKHVYKCYRQNVFTNSKFDINVNRGSCFK